MLQSTISCRSRITFGIGVGKMRNVTAVVSAIRFQQRLKQLNLLNGDLSESAIENLAQQFYREGYYGDVHVRPDKFFWQDVQNTLSRDGVSLAGLNQYADSYLREIPNELRFNRYEGCVAGVNLQLEYFNSFSRGIPASRIEPFFTLANAYLQYSHQLNLNSQLSFGINLAGGPNIAGDSQIRQRYLAVASIGYNYELTDRIVVLTSDVFNSELQNMGPKSKNLSNALGVTVNYFVEDNISLSTSYSFLYLYGNYSLYEPTSVNIINAINLGVTYYIDRGFIYE